MIKNTTRATAALLAPFSDREPDPVCLSTYHVHPALGQAVPQAMTERPLKEREHRCTRARPTAHMHSQVPHAQPALTARSRLDMVLQPWAANAWGCELREVSCFHQKLGQVFSAAAKGGLLTVIKLSSNTRQRFLSPTCSLHSEFSFFLPSSTFCKSNVQASIRSLRL